MGSISSLSVISVASSAHDRFTMIPERVDPENMDPICSSRSIDPVEISQENISLELQVADSS
jgi:hypothetical protein